jgi:hypothetical protein
MTVKRFLVAIGLTVATATAIPSAASAAPPGYTDPLPRIEGRLCPGVSGMRQDAALQLLDRIRHDATRIGIALADPNVCKPNMLIFFVKDTGETLNALMERQPQLFDNLSPSERSALKSGNQSVRAWNQVSTRTRDGMMIYDSDNLVQIPQTTMADAHSKIYVPVRRELVSTVVLFGSQDVTGMSLTQLADYAAMRAFANDFSALPKDKLSILNLFDGSGEPKEMTQTDLTFLETLYSGIPNLPGRFKNQTLEHALNTERADNGN